MIRLVSLAKSFTGRTGGSTIVFRPTTVFLPADRRIAVLGPRRSGKTVFLQLLAGAEQPEQGGVIAQLRFSPIVNSGPLLQPQLSVHENIRFYARVFGISSEWLLSTIAAFCDATKLEQPLKSHDIGFRKSLETILTVMLPFDCYLFDNVEQIAPEAVKLAFGVAAGREAGIVFTTNQLRLARQFADFGIVISDQTLYPFPSIEQAIGFHERRARA